MTNLQQAEQFYEDKEYEQSLIYYKRAFKEKHNKSKRDAIYYNIGTCYIRLKDYVNALDFLKKAYQLKKESERNDVLFNIAYCFASLDKYKEAYHLFSEHYEKTQDLESYNALMIMEDKCPELKIYRKNKCLTFKALDLRKAKSKQNFESTMEGKKADENI